MANVENKILSAASLPKDHETQHQILDLGIQVQGVVMVVKSMATSTRILSEDWQQAFQDLQREWWVFSNFWEEEGKTFETWKQLTVLSEEAGENFNTFDSRMGAVEKRLRFW